MEQFVESGRVPGVSLLDYLLPEYLPAECWRMNYTYELLGL